MKLTGNNGQFVSEHPGAKPYAIFLVLDIMSPGWQALVDDDYDSVFPVPGYTRLEYNISQPLLFFSSLELYSPGQFIKPKR